MSEKGRFPILIVVLVMWVILFSGALGSQATPWGEEKGIEKGQEVSQLKEDVRADPSNIELRLKLARLLYSSHRYQEAIEQYRAALELAPGNLEVRLELARVYVLAQQYEEAAGQYRIYLLEEPADVSVRLELARSLVSAVLYEQAIEEFQQVLTVRETDVIVRMELAYTYIKAGELEEAIEQFQIVKRLEPANMRAHLELGYLYNKVGEVSKARAEFEYVALKGNEQEIKQANEALRSLPTTQSPPPKEKLFWGRIYSNGTNYSRWDNAIVYFQLKEGIQPSFLGPFQFYVAVNVVKDTDSKGGRYPQIFSDNIAEAGLGVRVKPFKIDLYLYLEGYAGVRLIELPGKDRNFLETKAGFNYYQGWGSMFPIREREEDLIFPLEYFGELYTDVSYYSRYDDNIIGYIQTRQGLKFLQYKDKILDTYLRVNFVADTNKEFFNNIGEVGGGVRFRPSSKVNMDFHIEYIKGYYLDIESRTPNPYPSTYTDWRIGANLGLQW